MVVMMSCHAESRKLPWLPMMLRSVSMHCRFFTVNWRERERERERERQRRRKGRVERAYM